MNRCFGTPHHHKTVTRSRVMSAMQEKAAEKIDGTPRAALAG
jgi:hypothetical protein